MEKFHLFIACIAFFLYSCNNDSEPLSNQEEFELANQKEAVGIDSTEDLFSMFPPVPESEPIQPDSAVPDRDVAGQTVYGYTSYTSNGNRKVMFDDATAAVFGLSAGTYIAEFYTVRKEIPISENRFIAFLPEGCDGWLPNGENPTDYGYALEYNADSTVAILSTRVATVKYNRSGTSLNVWKPVNKELLHWNYLLYQ